MKYKYIGEHTVVLLVGEDLKEIHKGNVVELHSAPSSEFVEEKKKVVKVTKRKINNASSA